MPLELPNLDDRTYNDLVQEALGLIPSYAPEWTDYNPSDPGITLIEMFAYLTEMLIYRLNLVTDENKYTFLQLINGPDWKRTPNQTLNEEIQATILRLRQSDRAVSNQDFETLALQASSQVARVLCLPRRNLASTDNSAAVIEKPGHVSVVIIPHSQENNPQPSAELINQVTKYLDERRLLTTRVHVVGPKYLTIGIQITLVLNKDAEENIVRPVIVKSLQKFFHPLHGGVDGKGWEFGRNVYVSEIYELLDKQAGIDYITRTQTQQGELDEITVNSSDAISRQIRNQGKLIAINVQPNELINAQIDPNAITIITPISN